MQYTWSTDQQNFNINVIIYQHMLQQKYICLKVVEAQMNSIQCLQSIKIEFSRLLIYNHVAKLYTIKFYINLQKIQVVQRVQVRYTTRVKNVIQNYKLDFQSLTGETQCMVNLCKMLVKKIFTHIKYFHSYASGKGTL